MSKCQHQRYPKMSYKNLYSWNNAAGLQFIFIHLMQSKYNSMVSYWKWKAMDSNSYLGVSIDFQGVCVCEIWGITLPSGSRKKTRVWKTLGGYLLANTFLWYFHHWHFALYPFELSSWLGLNKLFLFFLCLFVARFIGVTALAGR